MGNTSLSDKERRSGRQRGGAARRASHGACTAQARSAPLPCVTVPRRRGRRLASACAHAVATAGGAAAAGAAGVAAAAGTFAAHQAWNLEARAALSRAAGWPRRRWKKSSVPST